MSIHHEWEGPQSDPLKADSNREAVYVGADVETDEGIVSVAIGDESKGEWVRYERQPLDLGKCR